jgi:hypothetical protein
MEKITNTSMTSRPADNSREKRRFAGLLKSHLKGRPFAERLHFFMNQKRERPGYLEVVNHTAARKIAHGKQS